MTKCTSCGVSGAYISCFTVECPNSKCEYYSPKLEKENLDKVENEERVNLYPSGFYFPHIPMIITIIEYK